MFWYLEGKHPRNLRSKRQRSRGRMQTRLAGHAVRSLTSTLFSNYALRTDAAGGNVSPRSAPDSQAVDISPATQRLCFYLFAAGGLAGLLQLSFEVGFGAEMVAVAKNLALHGSYGNPFYIQQTGPTAAVPPV